MAKNLSGARVQTVRRELWCSEPEFRQTVTGFSWARYFFGSATAFQSLGANPDGSVRLPYELDPRHSAAAGFHGFNSSDVMYLIMTDRFSDGDLSNDHLNSMPGTFDRSKPRAYHGGDLRGVENHLDYIQQLGATTIWITPLYAQDPNSPADYHGYGAFNMYAVNPHFGTLHDYEETRQ